LFGNLISNLSFLSGRCKDGILGCRDGTCRDRAVVDQTALIENFRIADADADELISRSEFLAATSTIFADRLDWGSAERFFMGIDTSHDYSVDISEYQAYMFDVASTRLNCEGECMAGNCLVDLQVNSPVFINAIRLESEDSSSGGTYTYYEGHTGLDQYATGLLHFRLLPNRYATLHITVAMIDDGGTENGGQDTFLRNITVEIKHVNSAPYAVFHKTFPMLEASVEIAHTLPLFALVSPGDKERRQTVELSMTTKPHELPALFVDKRTPLLRQQGSLQEQVAAHSAAEQEIINAQHRCQCHTDPSAPLSATPNSSTHICLCPWQSVMLEQLQDIRERRHAIQEILNVVDVAVVAVLKAPAASPSVSLEPDASLERYQKRGILHLTLKPFKSGVGQLSFTMTDDGGRDMGGHDTTSVSISIMVQPINDHPFFMLPSALVIVEDAGFLTMRRFAQALRTGTSDDEAWQTLTFEVQVEELSGVQTSQADLGAARNWSLFESRACQHEPQCSTKQHGFCATTATFLQGPSNTQGKWLAGAQMNLPPSLAAVHLTGTEEDAACGGIAPHIDRDGVLRMRTARDRYGEARLWVTVRDDGGSALGGSDVYGPVQMMLKVLAQPRVFSVIPRYGPTSGGNLVTLLGQDFGTREETSGEGLRRRVSLGGIECLSILVVSDSEIVCEAPPGIGGGAAMVELLEDGRAALPHVSLRAAVHDGRHWGEALADGVWGVGKSFSKLTSQMPTTTRAERIAVPCNSTNVTGNASNCSAWRMRTHQPNTTGL